MELNAGEIIMSLLALGFAAWAGVVGWIGHGFRKDFGDIRGELKGVRADIQKEGEKLNRYIIQTEARLSVIEDRLAVARQKSGE